MGCAKYLSFLLVLASATLVENKMCSLDDENCLKKGAAKFFETSLIPGTDSIEPLDPLRVDKIVGETTGIEYTVTNCTLTELKNCVVEKFKVKKEDLTFEYHLRCPQLFLYYIYELKGVLDNLSLDGLGEEKITIDDYLIIFKGKYALSISEKDKKPRGTVKSHVIETEPKGRITFNTTKLIRGDKKKLEAAIAYANKNWKAMEKVLKSPIIETFMKSLIDITNKHLEEIPLEDVIRQE